MIHLSIGRNSDNKIVIFDPTRQVSGNHAEIIMSMNGQMTIKDLSTNGTSVNGHQVPKFLDVPIKRGDKILFAGIAPLDWSRVPMIKPVDNSKHVVSIGKGGENQYQLGSTGTSRNHATLSVDKKGKVYLMDHSLNGTTVEGQRINSFQHQRIKRGAKVSFGNEKLNWKKIPGGLPFNKWLIIGPVAAAVVGVMLFLFWDKITPRENVLDRYKKSIVLVYNKMYFTKKDPARPNVITYIGKDGKEVYSENDLKSIEPFEIIGSGFFISNDGKIITNKHVLKPWEVEEYKQAIVRTNSIFDFLQNKTSVGGFSVELGIIPNGSNVNKDNLASSLLACNIASVRAHSDPNVDLALTQLNMKSLPTGMKFIDPKKDIIKSKEDIKDLEQVTIMGYPLGLGIGLTNQDKLINSNEVGNISMIRDRYQIQYTAPSTHGASGSPVYCNSNGKVCAVNFAGYQNAPGHNWGVFAYFINDLLDE